MQAATTAQGLRAQAGSCWRAAYHARERGRALALFGQRGGGRSLRSRHLCADMRTTGVACLKTLPTIPSPLVITS